MATLFIDNLTVIDFSYCCAQRGIVGASWIVDIELNGDLNEQGMVFDFGHVKKSIKRFIDNEFDHKLWLNKQLPSFKITQTANHSIASWQNNEGLDFAHSSPSSAVFILDVASIDTQTLEPLIALEIQRQLPSNVHSVSLALRQEAIEGPAYCYTHGLQKHDGNCQRIAHGHRSRIDIKENGKPNVDLEHYWAEQWQDIYLATRAHIIERNDTHTKIRYSAEQGIFELLIPSKHVYEVDIVTTVENIAEFIALETKKMRPQSNIFVKAYEGVAKGAASLIE